MEVSVRPVGRPGRRSLLVVVAVAAITGPAAVSGAGGPPDGPDLTGVELFAEYPRYLQVEGEFVEIAVDNGGPDDLWVTDVAVDVAGFGPGPAWPRPVLVRSGRRIDVKVGFGEVDCSVAPSQAAVTMRVAVGADADPLDGATATVAIESGPFADMHADLCGEREVMGAAELVWSDDFQRRGDVLTTSLDVTSIGGSSVRVESVRGSVIFAVIARTDAPPLGTVDADDPMVRIPVEIHVQRCDPHAVIESKKSYRLAVWATTDEVTAQHVFLEPEGALRAAMDELVQDCLTATLLDE